MTRAQVAELHGVIVDEIEKIIRRSDQPRKSLDPLISARTQLPVLDSASDAVDVRELRCALSQHRVIPLGVVVQVRG